MVYPRAIYNPVLEQALQGLRELAAKERGWYQTFAGGWASCPPCELFYVDLIHPSWLESLLLSWLLLL